MILILILLVLLTVGLAAIVGVLALFSFQAGDITGAWVFVTISIICIGLTGYLGPALRKDF